jgi:hypothetical protein
MGAYTPTLAVWPAWAQAAFAYTNTHPIAKGVPAMRGALAVAAYLAVANGLTWGQAFAYGMHAYGMACVAHAKAGGTQPTAKAFAGLTPASTVAQYVAAAAKTGFANTVQVANGMLGTIANNTAKGTGPLYFAPLANVASPVAFATKGNGVANAYNGVPAAQAPTGYVAPTKPTKAALPTLA